MTCYNERVFSDHYTAIYFQNSWSVGARVVFLCDLEVSFHGKEEKVSSLLYNSVLSKKKTWPRVIFSSIYRIVQRDSEKHGRQGSFLSCFSNYIPVDRKQQVKHFLKLEVRASQILGYFIFFNALHLIQLLKINFKNSFPVIYFK